tara:strand:- start:644 stop:787 length:144 start_codon:yes stop_codon:yes gene_type:complete
MSCLLFVASFIKEIKTKPFDIKVVSKSPLHTYLNSHPLFALCHFKTG